MVGNTDIRPDSTKPPVCRSLGRRSALEQSVRRSAHRIVDRKYTVLSNNRADTIIQMTRILTRMPSRLVLALTLFALTSAHPQTWHLVWSDEFNGPANSLPSSADWNFVRGWGPKGNHEIQFYCRPTDDDGPCDSKTHPNLYEDGNGHLVLTAIHDGQLWSSARLNTQGKHTILSGRVEAR